MAPRTTRTPRRVDDEITLLARLDSNKWLIGLVFGGLVNTGIMYQQFTQVKETLAANIAEQKVITGEMGKVQLQQAASLQDIGTLKAGAVTLESRVRSMEVMFMDSAKRGSK
jgi:acyl-CoA hydrolase